VRKGADVDILTGRPADEAARRQATEDDRREELKLQEKAAYLGIASSPEGQRLVELVLKRLERRIEKLVDDDPSASELVSVLRDLGHTESVAKRAVNSLHERHMRKKTS